MANRTALNWFEIPVSNLDRAQKFYETLLGTSIRRETMGPGSECAVPFYTLDFDFVLNPV